MLTQSVTTSTPSNGVLNPLYDIVLLNGRVVSTNADPRGSVLDQILNVGILSGKIAAISAENLLGREIVDCTGLIVSPGFVDIHYHGECKEAAQTYRVRDGITTSADTEWGMVNLEGDLQEIDSKGLISNYFASSSVVAGHNFAVSARKAYAVANGEGQVGEYHKQTSRRYVLSSFIPSRFWNQPIEQTDITQSLDSSFFSPSVREGVAKYPHCYVVEDALQTFGLGLGASTSIAKTTKLNVDEMTEALTLIEWGLQNGGTSIGLMGGYAPYAFEEDPFSQTPVLTDFSKAIHDLAKVYDCPVVEHGIAFPFPLGLQTTLDYVKRINGKYHYCHVVSTTAQPDNPNLAKEVVDLIEKAIDEGFHVSYEMYPWDGTSTLASAPFLADSTQINPENIIEVTSKTTLLKAAQDSGRSVSDEWTLWRTPPAKTVFIRQVNRQDNLDYAFTRPHCCVISDGNTSFTGKGHPRRNGSFARFLRMYTRERKLLSIPEAIRKMTSLPLSVLSTASDVLRRKGQIVIGFDADITVFNPDTVSENATYENPQEFSSGIPYVIINGQFVVRNSQNVSGVLPGRVIYGNLKAQGRPKIEILNKNECVSAQDKIMPIFKLKSLCNHCL